MRAGLVLLNRTPADVRNTRAVEAVILDGHLYNRLALDRRLSLVKGGSRAPTRLVRRATCRNHGVPQVAGASLFE